jgi:hypothetical protein
MIQIYQQQKITKRHHPIIINVINVEHLLYPDANVMQKLHNSSCRLFTISYATDIAF